MEDFRILVSVDGSECSDRVVAMAAELTFRGAIFLWRLWGKGWIGKKVTE